MRFGINTPPRPCRWRDLLDVRHAARIDEVIFSMRNPCRAAMPELWARAVETPA